MLKMPIKRDDEFWCYSLIHFQGTVWARGTAAVSREGKERALSFRQSGFLSLNEYWQLVSFETSQRIQSALEKITSLP